MTTGLPTAPLNFHLDFTGMARDKLNQANHPNVSTKYYRESFITQLKPAAPLLEDQ